jgi:hypothetical protein
MLWWNYVFCARERQKKIRVDRFELSMTSRRLSPLTTWLTSGNRCGRLITVLWIDSVWILLKFVTHKVIFYYSVLLSLNPLEIYQAFVGAENRHLLQYKNKFVMWYRKYIILDVCKLIFQILSNFLKCMSKLLLNNTVSILSDMYK